MLDDIKDAEKSMRSSAIVNKIEIEFNDWLYDVERVKENPDVNLNIFLYAFLRSVLRFGFHLYKGDIDKLKNLVNFIYLDITNKLDDHAES